MQRLGICLLAACSTRPPPAALPPPLAPTAPPRDAAVVEVPLPGHDVDGNPLPPGASARLGSLHLRHRNGATVVAYSPDGQHVATGDDKDITIWSLATGKPEAHASGYPLLGTLAYSPDGKLLVGADWETGGAHAWTAAGREAWTLDTDGIGVSDLAWSADGTRVAFAGVQHAQMAGGPPPAVGVFVLDAATGKPVHDYSARETRSVSSVAFSPDGKTLAYSRETAIVLAAPDTGKISAQLEVAARMVRFAADGKSLFVLDHDNRLARWDLATRRAQAPLAKNVLKFALSTDGTQLVASGDDGVRLIDLATSQTKLLGPANGYVEVAPVFTSDGRRVTQTFAWQGSSVQPTTWEVATGARVPLRGHASAISTIACSADSKTIVTAGYDGEVILWDLDGRERMRLPERDGGVVGAQLSRDGKRMLLPGGDKKIVIWDFEAGIAASVLTGHTDSIAAALWLDDGRVVSGGRSELFVWRDGQIEKRLPVGENWQIGALALSPDGKTLATGSTHTQLWDTATFAAPREVEALADAQFALAYSPDGKTLVGGGYNWLFVADASGHEIKVDHATGKHHTAVAFAPDGSWVLAVGWEGSGIYSLPDQKLLVPLDNGLTAAAVCADGKRMITAAPDGTATVWSVKALLEHSHGEARP